MDNLNKMNVAELDNKTKKQTGGGFIPLAVYGVAISAGTVKSLFIAGMAAGGAGAAAYLSE